MQGTFNQTGLAAETLAAARVALLPEDPSHSSAADFQRPASTPQAEALVSRVRSATALPGSPGSKV
jgi:hypothetical protein